ncbi:adenosylcobinamide-GDP ribazoletransferase [Gorillibacterium timonense]|uniref:adenosylcobinamide-GDP ribazoletransferase n=1 Tax=Gorillibacterium timonense TaxID=1689269 RepID=UPI00071D96BC|nr:adenosylcobinamide-GDP ribazoletransferase [Gorillibacterium timonense]
MVRNPLLAGLQAAAAAMQFLTRIPIPYQFDYTPRVFRQSVLFYPAVGGVIGLLLGLFAYAAGHLLPLGPAAVLTLILWVLLTGGLHLDGWMDAADGLMSHRSPERMLEIMKDSRVGAMGVMAAILLLLAKASFLYEVLRAGSLGFSDSSGGVELFGFSTAFGPSLLLLVVIPIWSRWWMVVCMVGWPYARKESGLGSLFREVRGIHAAASGAMAVLTTFLLTGLYAWITRYPSASSSIGSGTVSVLALAAILALTAAFLCFLFGWPAARGISRKLGGLTGDLYGAMNEGLEALLLLAAVAACTWLG